MGGGAVVPGRPARTWAAGPGGGYGVPARLASGPADQAIGVVAAVGLARGKVPGRRGCGAGIRGRHRDGWRWLRTDGRGPGRGASGRWQAADFEQLEPERLDLREHPIQRGAVGQRPGQHGVAAACLGLQGREAERIVSPRRPRTQMRYRYAGQSARPPVTFSPRTR